jgi:hypothetical protein
MTMSNNVFHHNCKSKQKKAISFMTRLAQDHLYFFINLFIALSSVSVGSMIL